VAWEFWDASQSIGAATPLIVRIDRINACEALAQISCSETGCVRSVVVVSVMFFFLVFFYNPLFHLIQNASL
jgi:hypothetical protein